MIPISSQASVSDLAKSGSPDHHGHENPELHDCTYLLIAELDYSKAIGEGKHEIAIFSKVVKIFFYHPILSMKNILINMLLLFLGPSGNSILNGIKNKLHFIIPFKVLSKLNR